MSVLAASIGVEASAATAKIGQFTDEALVRGLVYQMPPFATGFVGYGVALADLNGDGHLDVVATGAQSGLIGIFENDGTGHFADRSASSGVPPIPSALNIACVDLNDDGLLELVVLRLGEPTLLFRNEDGFTFTDITPTSGISGPMLPLGVGAADIDGDGWTDLFIPHYRFGWPGTLASRHQIWRNNGDETFVNIAPALGLDLYVLTMTVALFDPDLDGDLDILLSNDRGHFPQLPPNLFYRNDGGTFVEIGQSNGTGLGFFSMGTAVGDVNRDGIADLYHTNSNAPVPQLYGANPLLIGSPTGIYSQAQAAWGVAHYIFSWACLFFDANNDGTQDLFVVNQNVPNTLYLNPGDPPMINATAMAGLTAYSGKSYCAAIGDVDGDGDVDIITNSFAANLRLYINPTNDTASWVKLAIVGERQDPNALGATVTMTQGGVSQIRHLLLGDGYLGQSSFDVHFGLGQDTSVDELVIRWPWTGSVRTLTNYPANQRWTIHPPGRLGDFDGDGQVTQKDLSRLAVHCGASVVPGLEMLDLNGDGLIDQLDVPPLLERLSGPVGDLNDDGVVDGSDLGVLLGAWGGLCAPEDLDANGVVDGGDLGTLLGNWSGG